MLEGLSYDDVLMVPAYSKIKSRSEVDLSVNINGKTFKHPIIPANMKTISGLEMMFEVCNSRGLGILHRFMPVEEQVAICQDLIDNFGEDAFAVSVGVKEEDKNSVKSFLKEGVEIFCIDIAHGDSKHCLDMISFIKNENKNTTVIAGNVATGQGAERLWDAGADIVKVGIGPGSLCSTRVETGNGVPQLTAIMDVAETKRTLKLHYPHRNYMFIADGGIKSAGDCCKALAFADMVMVGNMFAGCEETPGQIMKIDGRAYKEYVGSSTHKSNHVEGVAALVSTKGKYKDILSKMLEGIKSGCSYQGASNLEELKDNPQFIKITGAGLRESHPHDVQIIK